MPRPTSPLAYSPNESGPRWTMTSHIARTRSALARSPGVSRSSPAIPHMALRPPAAGASMRRGQLGHRRAAGSRRAAAARRGPRRARAPRTRGGRRAEAEPPQDRGRPRPEVRVLAAAVRVAEVAHRRADRGRERVARLRRSRASAPRAARGAPRCVCVTVCAPIVQPAACELADLRPVEHRARERAGDVDARRARRRRRARSARSAAGERHQRARERLRRGRACARRRGATGSTSGNVEHRERAAPSSDQRARRPPRTAPRSSTAPGRDVHRRRQPERAQHRQRQAVVVGVAVVEGDRERARREPARRATTRVDERVERQRPCRPASRTPSAAGTRRRAGRCRAPRTRPALAVSVSA